eukprot:6916858-Prymnesium_polylepis.1
MAPPPLEINADALSRAIDDARAKGVEQATVARAEAKLQEGQVRTAAHAHLSGWRVSVCSRAGSSRGQGPEATSR